MPVVIPLADCISRPGEGAGGLVTHLKAVAGVAGNPVGDIEERLAYLAGLAHDAAKADWEWQEYIRKRISRGPSHAPLGAALFLFWAESLLEGWVPDARERRRSLVWALDWVRVIDGHHGRIDDLTGDVPWEKSLGSETLIEQLERCEVAGLDALVRSAFPEYSGTLANFPDWLTGLEAGPWPQLAGKHRISLIDGLRGDEAARNRLGLRVAELGGRLIYADRLHAAEWEPDYLTAEQAQLAIVQFAKHCKDERQKAIERGASPDILAARDRLQTEALVAYQAAGNVRFFSLLLPTGYGKTMTGLRVGLEAVASGRCRRLIYVAPYISILSQAAGEIEAATGQQVFLHHHLSILGREVERKGKVETAGERLAEETATEDGRSQDLMDSWQAPLLATTFNQLFRALFPARAQECVRIPALDGAFLFIDEPQIVDVAVWAAFVRALAVVSEIRNCTVLFSTATLPPVDVGLGAGRAVVSLVPDVKPVASRYVLRSTTEPWDARRAAKELQQRHHGTVAGIFNTIRDAVTVFGVVCPEPPKVLHPHQSWYFLAAMMLPGHKRQIIDHIYEQLKDGAVDVGVVCTQVLEAGVDLSFRSLLRARPIFPSAVQAAGRANRHGEGDRAEVLVFPFVRENGKESRSLVYRDGHACEVTDTLLAEYPELDEADVPQVLREYYRRCEERNPHTGCLQWFDEAARGCWEALAGREPFDGSYPKRDIYIPGAERYFSDGERRALASFGVANSEELLELSRDRTRRPRHFRERRRLSALLRQCIVSVPHALADHLASAVSPEDWLWRLDRPEDYSPQTGLAHHVGEVVEPKGGSLII